MSESNNNPKDSLGFRKLGKGDFAVVIGVIGVIVIVLVMAGVLIWYFRGNQPEKQEVADPAADAAEETAGLTLPPPPPLAVLPPVSFPPDNPYSESKAELGKMLFFDPRFSGDGSISCASCHPTSDGSWTVNSAISFGYPGSTH